MGLTRDDYLSRDATGLAALVHRNEVTPAELLDCALAEADRANPIINAIVHRWDDEARLAARTLPGDAKLAGVPMLLKDMACAYAGQGTRLASQWVPRLPAPGDSASVARMKQAGLMPFGFTNASEFGVIGFCETDLYGPARNPYDLSRTAGGSSGGAAAAVAAGIVPVAHASDGGGSIRMPAACCGLVGLKASRGRISVAPDSEWGGGTAVQGVVTRTVRDTAAMLEVLSGYVTGDPYACLGADEDFGASFAKPPGRLRIDVYAGPLRGATAEPDCSAAAFECAQLCRALGHDVREGSPPILQDEAFAPALSAAFHTMYSVTLAAGITQCCTWLGKPATPDDFEALTWAYYEEGRAHGAVAYVDALRKLGWLARSLGEYFSTVDVWLTPTLYRLPPPVGSYNAKAPGATLHDPYFASVAPACPMYNMAGLPAISLPLHWTQSGLPVGLQFGAGYGREAMLLQLAHQLEQAQPWAHHLPARLPT